ncbi:MAG: HTH domain-containing protein, partial [Bacteroidota bacterium]
MKKHRGEILELAVRRSPYSIKKLAQELRVSRNTIYN